MAIPCFQNKDLKHIYLLEMFDGENMHFWKVDAKIEFEMMDDSIFLKNERTTHIKKKIIIELEINPTNKNKTLLKRIVLFEKNKKEINVDYDPIALWSIQDMTSKEGSYTKNTRDFKLTMFKNFKSEKILTLSECSLVHSELWRDSTPISNTGEIKNKFKISIEPNFVLEH